MVKTTTGRAKAEWIVCVDGLALSKASWRDPTMYSSTGVYVQRMPGEEEGRFYVSG